MFAAGRLAQRLRTCAALAEDQSSAPSIHIRCLTACDYSCRGVLYFSVMLLLRKFGLGISDLWVSSFPFHCFTIFSYIMLPYRISQNSDTAFWFPNPCKAFIRLFSGYPAGILQTFHFVSSYNIYWIIALYLYFTTTWDLLQSHFCFLYEKFGWKKPEFVNMTGYSFRIEK